MTPSTTVEESGSIRGRIFIAGTGRSGTSRLNSLLGEHPEIFALPTEFHLITDCDGLRDLVDALTVRHTYSHADKAVRRFDELARQELAGRRDTPLRNLRLDERFGAKRYFTALNEFVTALTGFSFHATVRPAPLCNPTHELWPSEQATVRQFFGKYFENRLELVGLAARFVDRLYGAAALEQGKTRWCEKTPMNLLTMDFLWEFFPDAVVVHIKRDPRGVFASLLDQPWAPSDPEHVLMLLEAIYARWAQFRNESDLSGRRYLEVKLEDLADRTSEQMNAIQGYLGVAPIEYREDSLDAERVRSRIGRLDPSLRRLCEERLEPYFELMGYRR